MSRLWSDILRTVFLGLLVTLLTFPAYDWTYAPGIDPPLIWVFNYLIAENPGLGRRIIFPHGPLAFLMYPTGVRVHLAVGMTLVLNTILVYCTSNFLAKRPDLRWWGGTLVAYILAAVSSFNHLLLFAVLALYLLHFSRPGKAPRYVAFALVAIAFYIRSYVAILAGLLTVAFLVYEFAGRRNWKRLLMDGGLILLMLWAIWMLCYGTVAGFLRYGLGMVRLASDNSAAVSLYPDNNWWVLIPFLLLQFGMPFAGRDRRGIFFGCLTTLALFAAWKHGMSREDWFHLKGLWIWVFGSGLLLSLFVKRHRVYYLVGTLVSAGLLMVAARSLPYYAQPNVQLMGVHHFVDYAFRFNDWQRDLQSVSESAVAPSRLPDSLRQLIGKESVDVYPWDYSPLPANDLVWQPRVVLQSYVGYTSWLDRQNAEHVTSDRAAELLLWHRNTAISGPNESDFASIDGRYLLNDEPQTILALLRHYEPIAIEADWGLYRKRPSPLFINQDTLADESIGWTKWAKVPNVSGGLLRVHPRFDQTLGQRLRGILYKEEAVWMGLQLADGTVHDYRIVPKNAADGIWINPYLFDRHTDTLTTAPIKAIQFRGATGQSVDRSIRLIWIHTQFEQPAGWPAGFFGKRNKQ